MDLLSVPTILICTFMAMSAASLVMGIVWFYNRQEHSAGFWALGFLLGAMSGISVALRTLAPEHLQYAIAVHSILLITAFMLVWNGFRAFNRQPIMRLAIFAVPTAWLVLYLLWQPLREDANVGIAVLSTIIASITFLCAYAAYTGPGNRSLPMALPITIFLVTHGLFHCAHIGFAVFDPSPVVEGRVVASWWRILLLEGFLHTVLTGISCVILIKDRSEQRHRLASETDALTGVANRRAFVMRAEAALENASDTAVLAIIDIDYFKQINDQYGHQTGDHALIAFANLIANMMPEGAHFGRIGGEEFGLFLPETVARPDDVLKDLLHSVELLTISTKNSEFNLTTSIGVASVREAGSDFDTLIAAADCALYLAKQNGRNCIVSYSSTLRLHHLIENASESPVDLIQRRVGGRSAEGKFQWA